MLSNSDVVLYLNYLVNSINTHEFHKYKFSHYEKTVKLIVDIISKRNQIDLSFNGLIILKIISNVSNSHIYINKIKNIIKTNNYYDMELLFHVAEKSTMPVFLFWWNSFYKNKMLSTLDYINLLLAGLTNTDDRIYKYILDFKNIQNMNEIFTENHKQLLLERILVQITTPRKYTQKKLMRLSLYTNLSSQLEFMITLTTDIKIKTSQQNLLFHEIFRFWDKLIKQRCLLVIFIIKISWILIFCL